MRVIKSEQQAQTHSIASEVAMKVKSSMFECTLDFLWLSDAALIRFKLRLE